MRVLSGDYAPAGKPAVVAGHAHFWQRMISRRAFLAGTTLGVGGAAMYGAGLPLFVSASAGVGAPRPVPGTVDVAGMHFHINLPGTGDQSTIFDFNGAIAATDTSGVGAGAFSGLTFDADMRVMQGEFIDLAGRHQHGTFGFI